MKIWKKQNGQPAAPTGLNVTSARSNQLTISWTTTSGANHKVYVGTATGTEADAIDTTDNPYTALSTSVGSYVLISNSQYNVAVYAVDAVDSSLVSPALSGIGITVYEAPLHGYPSNPTTNSVDFTWDPPYIGGGAVPITGYHISDGYSSMVAPPTPTNITIDSLESNTPYGFIIAAISLAGRGDVSLSIYVTTLPNAPAAPSLSPGSDATNTIVVSWTAPTGGNDIVDYVVEWTANSATATIVATGNSTTLTSLTPGELYSVNVKARNSAGAGAKSPSASHRTNPAQPYKPTVSMIGVTDPTTSLVVTWVKPAGVVDTYGVTLYNEGSLIDPVTGFPQNETGLTATYGNLIPGRLYTATVVAYSGGLAGLMSDASNKIRTNPPKPTTVTLSQPTSDKTTSLEVTWSMIGTEYIVSSYIINLTPANSGNNAPTVTYTATFTDPTNKIVGGLTPGESYTATVQAVSNDPTPESKSEISVPSAAQRTETDLCSISPCVNGGTCVPQPGDYTCSCVDGYSGSTCEIDIDECATNPCMNGGTCIDGVNQFTCNCADGFTGDRCQNDLCSNNPCENNGTCIFMTSQYFCQCLDGYSGRNCLNDPCSNVVCGGDCEVVGSNGVCSQPSNGTDGLVIGLACALGIAFLLLLVSWLYFLLQKRNVDKNATVHHNQAFKVEEEYEKYEVAYEEIGDDYSLEKNKILDLYVGLTANYNAKIIKQFGDMARKIDFTTKPTFKKMVKLSCSVGSDKGYQLLISPSPRIDNLPTFWKEVCERRVRIIVGFPVSHTQLYPAVGKSENFGSMKISTKETKNFFFFSMSKVEIVERLTEFQNVSMETIVFEFNPNYDIITSNNLFVWLTNKVSEIPITDDSSMAVFGSDIPSGLFAAYNLLIRSNGNKIDIYDQVLNLRRINPKFFQNLESYTLLHELLVEYFELGNTERGTSQIKSEISTRNEFDLLRKTVNPFKHETLFNLRGSVRNTKVFASCVDNPEKFWTKIMEEEPGLVVSCDKHKTLTKLGLNNRRRQTFGKMTLNLGKDFVEVESLGVKHKVKMVFMDGSNWINTSKKFQQLCDQFMRVVVIINDNEVTMLALSQLLNRFETESKFDVYRQVKELGLEVTMEQYDTIYKCMLRHIQEENTYVNSIC